MKAKFFKHATLSLIVIIIWMLYVFFNFYCEERGAFYGIGLFFNYIYGCLFALFIGILSIILRVVFSKKSNPLLKKTDFIFIFSGFFNALIFIIWIIALALKILLLDNEAVFYFIGNFIICSTIFYCIYTEFKKEAR
jgi:hypothetical protein